MDAVSIVVDLLALLLTALSVSMQFIELRQR